MITSSTLSSRLKNSAGSAERDLFLIGIFQPLVYCQIYSRGILIIKEGYHEI